MTVKTTPNSTTRGIEISVASEYLSQQSQPEKGAYMFIYHVTVNNRGQETAQLISRHWIITNADGQVSEVRGPGVVGHQPVLKPGMSFAYSSFCPLNTPIGSMRGSYQMTTASGEGFDAVIMPFTLAVPEALN